MAETISTYLATVPAGSRVIVMVSRGENPSAVPYIEVPDVAGRAVSHATSRLEQLGFSVRTVNEYSDDVPRSRLIGQLPSGGSGAPEGSEVVLLVSSGPEIHERPAVVLPEVVGMHEREAVAMLETAGLLPQIAREYNHAYPEGVVSSQLPDRTRLAKPRRSRAPWWVWAVAAGVLALLALTAFFLLGRQERVRVPDVVGSTQARAMAVLREAGLEPRAVTEEPDQGDTPAGTVSSQNPQPDAIVAKGSVVEIRIVGKPEAAVVPDVVGLTSQAAQSRLRGLGFVVELAEKETDTSQPGLVVQQTPQAGTELPSGETVALVIAKASGADESVVPSVEGLALRDAQSTLRDAQLDVDSAENPSTDIPEGVVILQYPAAETKVAPGTTIGLIVSNGPPEDATTLQLPDVVGEQMTEAQAQVVEAGLRSQPVAVDGSGVQRNQVLAQLPPAGAAVAPGSIVLLFYASGR